MDTKTTLLPFTKMHGLGNDFVIINAFDKPIALDRLSIPMLANRHTGIGFDQLLVVEPGSENNFYCRIFNADGSEAEQCGNGLRCVARLLHEERLTSKSFALTTKAGRFPVTIADYDHISISMGTPCVQEKLMKLENTHKDLSISVISMGNPHAILKVDQLALDIHSLGNEINRLALFPNGANVGFMQIQDKQHIHLRTFERGIGETLACGSNACAAVVAGIVNGWLTKEVEVLFRYGSLSIVWGGSTHPVQMIGPATRVYSGELSLFSVV